MYFTHVKWRNQYLLYKHKQENAFFVSSTGMKFANIAEKKKKT